MNGMTCAMAIGMMVGLIAGSIMGSVFKERIVYGPGTEYIDWMACRAFMWLANRATCRNRWSNFRINGGGVMGTMVGYMLSFRETEMVIQLLFVIYISVIIMLIYMIKRQG